jgi:hypothetical protein
VQLQTRPGIGRPQPGQIRRRRRHSSARFSIPATTIRKPTPAVEARRSTDCGVIVFIAVADGRAGVPENIFPAAADP